MFACNQGGHFSQMMALHELFGKYDTVLVTDNVHASKEKTPALKNIGVVEHPMGMANKRNKLSKCANKEEVVGKASGYIALILSADRYGRSIVLL